MIRATFKLRLDEIDTTLLQKIKSIFGERQIVEVNISDDTEETDYLLSTEANRESLLRSLEQLQRKDFVSVGVSDLHP
jgi:hypothetical protein